MKCYVQQDFLVSNKDDSLPGKCMSCSLVHQDEAKQTRSLQFGTKYGTTATITTVSYAMAHAMCKDRKRHARHISAIKKLNVYKIPLSGPHNNVHRTCTFLIKLSAGYCTQMISPIAMSTLNCRSDDAFCNKPCNHHDIPT